MNNHKLVNGFKIGILKDRPNEITLEFTYKDNKTGATETKAKIITHNFVAKNLALHILRVLNQKDKK